MIPIHSLCHVVHHLPFPVVVTNASGMVVGASALAQSILSTSVDDGELHLDDHLATLAAPGPTTDRTPITCDTGEHELVVLGSVSASAPVVAPPSDVSKLAGEIAHDFNNLLGVIINYATLAAADAPEGSQQARDLAEVLSASRRAAEISDRLRRMSTARNTN